MESISDYLTAHHADCDEAFARARDAAAAGDWAAASRWGGMFLREIARHIDIEEELLFPAFERSTGSSGGPTAVMRAEHERMREWFATMREALEARDAERYAEASRALGALLEGHNMKEENILYPMLDRLLGPDARDLIARAEATAA